MSEEPKKPNEIRFLFGKTRHHRAFRVSGAWASTTPGGEIQVSFFNDLRPMPNMTIHTVAESGDLGPEVSRDLEVNDVVREVDVTVVIDADTSARLVTLLTTLVKRLQSDSQAAKEPKAATELIPVPKEGSPKGS
jgi:hypothetical protein